ncbi:tetratricopeptide repeat protein [Flavicella sediminum]|uniref:tetratricopeptide repeat protein n=1 Tax=Flavicella sediminum TaxID=2585141 RepID=UPI00111FC80E|nr:tetratricopeptide repeat protein [Flavicella sediminum]
MKNQLLLLMALAISVSVTGQKKELKAAAKALKKGKYSEMWTPLNAVGPMFKDMDDKYKGEFLYLKAKAIYGKGMDPKKDVKVAKAFTELVDFEKTQKSKKYSKEAAVVISRIVKKTAEDGSSAYKDAKYNLAAEKFELVYELSPLDTLYKLNAALSYYNNKDYDKAIHLYQDLLELGFTGIYKEFKAKSVVNDEVLYYNSEKDMNSQVAMKIAKDPEVKLSKSKTGDMVRNIALSYIAKGDNEKALEAISKAKVLFPKDAYLVIQEANINLGLGNNEKFLQGMKDAIALNPNQPELYFNVGVITMQKGYDEEAMGYFQKSVELKEDHAESYMNMGSIILGEASKMQEELNNSFQDFKKYDKLLIKRNKIYKRALPHFEKAFKYRQKDEDLMKTLISLYQRLEMYDKEKEVKALKDAL